MSGILQSALSQSTPMESRDNDDELNFSPALPIDEANADQDVLRYLRGVRNEASTMNQILYYDKSQQEDEDSVALFQQVDVVADVEFDAWSTQLVNKFKLLKRNYTLTMLTLYPTTTSTPSNGKQHLNIHHQM